MIVKSSDSAKVADEFGEDIRHIEGNLFKVRRSTVRMARSGLSSVDGKLVYGNPRWYLGDNGKPEAKGLDGSKMEELKDSIRQSGMDHPIRLRAVSEGGSRFLEIVNGERRFRAVEQLIEDKIECFDPSSGKNILASDMYDWVECRVDYMDDATALHCAFRLNETGEVIGETANIAMVKVLRESGYDNQEILKVTGKSLSWLRETDRIIGLDEVCLENLKSESINRRVALRLAMIQDVEERVALLEKIKASAESRHAEKVRHSKTKAEEAKAEAITSVADSFEAEINGDDDSELKEKAAEKAAKKAERAAAKLREAEAVRPKAVGKDMREVEGTSKPLSIAKIASLYLEPLAELIKNEGGHEDGSFNLDQLVLTHAILQAIMSGNRDMWSVLKENCSYVETSDEEEEDSDVEASDEEEEDEDENSDVEASDEEEEEEEGENSYVEASDEEEEEEEGENSYVEASDEEEYEEGENSYVEASDEEEEEEEDFEDDSDDDGDYDDDEMTSELEREFQEELRAIDRM